ncbi:MAG: type I-C CRISPR-associated protein Cas8c/Csd1 [Planctomycetales bacterium]|nr:type I-C CRISPR-associated protein Cas8c/Csd1 [Planctomycetales bacterium]
MLNELYELSRSLDDAGLKVVSWHKFLKECPRGGKSFFVGIDAASQITTVCWISNPERVASLRKYEKAAGYSFPAFNIRQLWQFDDQTIREEAAKLRKWLSGKNIPSVDEVFAAVSSLIGNARSTWIDPNKKSGGRDEMDKVAGCLTAPVDELLQAVTGNSDTTGKAIATLLERTKELDGDTLHSQLSDWVVRQFSQPSDHWLMWFDLLFWITGKTPKSSSLIFELADQSDFEFPVHHPRSYEYINKCLQGTDGDTTNGEDTSQLPPDAYAASDAGRDESFPIIKMSRFGNINLRAMSRESLCQLRYGVAESKSFPVSQSTRQKCKDALEWISRDERKDQTWCDITGVSGATSVLFAYPSRLANDTPPLSQLFGGDDESSNIETEGQFEACAKAVVQSLTGHKATDQSNDVVIFILTKPDGFRTKVVYSYRCSETHILESAKDWQIGCLNHPEIRTRQFGANKGDTPVWRDTLTPFVAEIIACANTVWIRGGTESSTCKSATMSDALSLMLDDSPRAVTSAEKLLGLVLKNATSLLLAMGQAEKQGRVHAVAKNLQKHQLLLPRIFGLLLWKLHIHKGDFMKTPPFLIGRLLSLADQLHFLYCQEVRKGDVPPQLVGNAIMPTALATPEHALSILADRMRPYKAWADTVRTGEKVGLARYFIAEMGEVCNQIAEQNVPKRTNDSDRATMLLGYLCRPKKVESTTTEGESDQ